GERDDLRSFSDEQADAIAASIKERDALRAALQWSVDMHEGNWLSSDEYPTVASERKAWWDRARALLDGGTDEKVASS
ncbi:MAG: hypothetical protein ACXADB_12895, partial [Candidatus Hermodarchaeia archaeon]